MGFWSKLVSFFTGGESSSGGGDKPAGGGKPERYCMACHKVTPGSIQDAEGKTSFHCAECGQQTKILM